MTYELTTADRGTRTLFGKPYHYHLATNGRLTLVKGSADDCADTNHPETP